MSIIEKQLQLIVFARTEEVIKLFVNGKIIYQHHSATAQPSKAGDTCNLTIMLMELSNAFNEEQMDTSQSVYGGIDYVRLLHGCENATYTVKYHFELTGHKVCKTALPEDLI